VGGAGVAETESGDSSRFCAFWVQDHHARRTHAVIAQPQPAHLMSDTLRFARPAVLLVALAVASGVIACSESLNPCSTKVFENSLHPLRAKFMDGDWFLVSINGQPLVAPGFVLPRNAGLLGGTALHFYTFKVDEGTCSEPKSSSGEVVATYNLKDSKGVASKQEQTGSFTLDNGKLTVTLRALGYSVQAQAALHVDAVVPSTMILNATIPNPENLTLDNFKLSFERR